MKRVLARGAVLVASLCIVLVTAELGLRVARGNADNADNATSSSGRHHFNPYEPSAELGYTLRANWRGVHQSHEFDVAVHTNNLGLRRGEETSTNTFLANRRILLVGDSLAFGVATAGE